MTDYRNIQTALRYKKVTSAHSETVAKALGRLSGSHRDAEDVPV